MNVMKHWVSQPVTQSDLNLFSLVTMAQYCSVLLVRLMLLVDHVMSCDILLGVLLRKLEAGLMGISHVIVDEIHERDINVSHCVVCNCQL